MNKKLPIRDINFFLAPSGDYSYEWQDGSSSSIYILQTTEGVATTEVIGVSVTNDYGCELTDIVIVTVQNCVGIDEEEFSNWSIYPNPLQASATINLEGIDNNSLCQIRDSRGRIVDSIQATDITVWDASKLNAGLYLVEVLNENGVAVWHSKAMIQ